MVQVNGGLLDLLDMLWSRADNRADAAVKRHIVNALGNCGCEIVSLQPEAAEVLTGTHRVLTRYSHGAHTVLTGYSHGTHGVLAAARCRGLSAHQRATACAQRLTAPTYISRRMNIHTYSYQV